MFCEVIYNYYDTFLNISLLRIRRTQCCLMGTGITKETGTLLKLLTKAEEKREKYSSLYLTLNFHSPTKIDIG